MRQLVADWSRVLTDEDIWEGPPRNERTLQNVLLNTRRDGNAEDKGDGRWEDEGTMGVHEDVFTSGFVRAGECPVSFLR